MPLTLLVFQIVLTHKAIHQTESMTLALSLQKFPRTAVTAFVNHVFYKRVGHTQRGQRQGGTFGDPADLLQRDNHLGYKDQLQMLAIRFSVGL
jgi:hypothetical protein